MASYPLGYKMIAKPSNSLSPKGFVWLFTGIVLVVAIIAIGMSQIGAWFVLPFAGLEVLAFAVAFYQVHVHYNDYESISLEGDNVVIEKHTNKSTEKITFQRYWVKVTLRDMQNGTVSLFIGSHGKQVEFGQRFMDDMQRIELAKQLKVQLAKFE
ncbi:MAG: DUF2244 domain-containing protein [Methylotenera sp.]|nr:DUF2244 domain-containing protein [Methylotenera sp.]